MFGLPLSLSSKCSSFLSDHPHQLELLEAIGGRGVNDPQVFVVLGFRV